MRELKEQVFKYCEDTEEEEVRSEAAEKAILALILLQKIQHECGRLSKGVSQEMDDCAELSLKQILEMEIQYQVPKAQIAIPDIHNQPARNIQTAEASTEPREEVYTNTQTRFPRNYEEAVK